MLAEGTVFRCGVHVGVDIAADELRDDYDAIVLAGGCTVPRDLPVPGAGLDGIHQAMEYLPLANRSVADGLVGAGGGRAGLASGRASGGRGLASGLASGGRGLASGLASGGRGPGVSAPGRPVVSLGRRRAGSDRPWTVMVEGAAGC